MLHLLPVNHIPNANKCGWACGLSGKTRHREGRKNSLTNWQFNCQFVSPAYQQRDSRA